MAITDSEEFLTLLESLRSNITGYDFFQIVRLLEKNILENNFPSFDLLLEPAAELSFPATDIKSIKIDESQRISMQLNFMGLYGVDSPLPQYLFARLAQDDEISNRTKIFFNIFNHRIYYLFYLAWKKYRTYIELEHGKNSYLNYLIALSGSTLVATDKNEFAFVSLLGARNHTSAGLSGLLKKYLNVSYVFIHQFIPLWMDMNQNLILGKQGIDLGNNSLLGNQVIDINSKIKIEIGPIDSERVVNFLPSQTEGKCLWSLIYRYLGPLYEFDVIFVVQLTNLACLNLGKKSINLGWAFWLGQPLKSTYKLEVSGHL